MPSRVHVKRLLRGASWQGGWEVEGSVLGGCYSWERGSACASVIPSSICRSGRTPPAVRGGDVLSSPPGPLAGRSSLAWVQVGGTAVQTLSDSMQVTWLPQAFILCLCNGDESTSRPSQATEKACVLKQMGPVTTQNMVRPPSRAEV